ncbi:MAG: protein kinase [Iphinoe sp. HA4291-MV1]|jgi:serine/threonine protein kinase|nr:protein kinase [Iphinoe sp. HA4291-MV1]
MIINPGQSLFGGRYVIERELGKGGIGITFLAKNRRGELRVVKTFREDIFNSPTCRPYQNKLRDDFKNEALRLSLCRHPHIVQVENVFDEGDFPCMAMEYIEGEDLGDRIKQKGVLPEAEALRYIQQIGDALTLVHDRGLLHRDLKPSNIMMRADKAEAVLIDFGIARQFISGANQRLTVGYTPGYAPPEQYNSEVEAGEYIDVYALAATLYHLLTRFPPIVANQRKQFTLQPPKDINLNVSDRVNDAIMRGMALNYRYRPQSVQEWLDLLEIVVPPTIPVANPTPVIQPIISPPQLPTSNSPAPTVKFPSQPQSEKPISPVVTPDNWECVHTILSFSGKVALSPKGDILAGIAGCVIHLFEVSTGKLIRTLTDHHSNSVRSVAFSADGRILASGSRDKTIKLWDVQTAKEICTLDHFNGVSSVAFSPDEHWLAGGDDSGNIKIWRRG